MNLRDRVQTWFADRVSSVQYPHIRPVPIWDRPKSVAFFKYQMPWYRRIEMLIISLCALFVSLIALFAICLVAYCFISAAMGI